MSVALPNESSVTVAVVKRSAKVVMPQNVLFPYDGDPKNVVYTPNLVAQDMVQWFKPSGRVLDPCKGDGIFLEHLPEGTQWCEITEGVDFFNYWERVDWIMSNPPYSGFYEWIYHSMKIADNFVYLLPANKPFISNRLMMLLREWGEIKHMRFYGTGNKLGFPVGFAIAAFHFERGNKNGCTFSYWAA